MNMKTIEEQKQKVFDDIDGIITYCALSEHKEIIILGMVIAFFLRRLRKSV